MITVRHRAENLRRAIREWRAYDWAAKVRLHNAARALLRAIANDRFKLHPDAYDIRSNKAGPAVSGEVTFHSDTLYVQISISCIGSIPAVMYRKCAGRKDYTGGRNRFADVLTFTDRADESFLSLVD